MNIESPLQATPQRGAFMRGKIVIGGGAKDNENLFHGLAAAFILAAHMRLLSDTMVVAVVHHRKLTR